MRWIRPALQLLMFFNISVFTVAAYGAETPYYKGKTLTVKMPPFSVAVLELK